MPKVKLNPIFEQISGKMGDVVFRVLPSGETTIAKRPDMSKVEPREAQTAQRERFKQATADAEAAMTDPEARAVYKAAKEHKRPFALAFSDYDKGNDLLSKK